MARGETTNFGLFGTLTKIGLSKSSSTITENDEHSKTSLLEFGTAVESVQGSLAKVHIDTLSPYVSSGGGV